MGQCMLMWDGSKQDSFCRQEPLYNIVHYSTVFGYNMAERWTLNRS